MFYALNLVNHITFNNRGFFFNSFLVVVCRVKAKGTKFPAILDPRMSSFKHPREENRWGKGKVAIKAESALTGKIMIFKQDLSSCSANTAFFYISLDLSRVNAIFDKVGRLVAWSIDRSLDRSVGRLFARVVML